MRYKIVIDSCGELIERWKEDPSIERASLTLTVDEEDEANKLCKQEDLNIDDAETGGLRGRKPPGVWR